MTRRSGDDGGWANERGKEAIKAKHVVELWRSQGHRDSFPSTLSTQSLSPHCPLPILSGPPPHTRLFDPDPVRTTLPSLPLSSPSPSPIDLSTTSAHLRTHHLSHPFAPSIPHDPLSFLLVMATHGPINGVKINRACSGSFAHILARPRFSFLPLARIGCSYLFWLRRLLTLNPSPFASCLHPPSALCRTTSC